MFYFTYSILTMKTLTILIGFLFFIAPSSRAQDIKKSTINISETEDLCSQLNKVIESGREFETIKGKIKSSAGAVEIYESTIVVPGTKETAIYANAYTSPLVI